MADDFTSAADQAPGSTRVLLREESGSVVRRTVLDNGLRIVTEQMPGSRSVAFGAWVGAGSRDESPEQHGAAHYLEHLLFKATARRTAFEVNAAIDAVGGEMNAFTSRETTCFYAHTLGDDLPIAVDLVLDVVTAALMRDEDVDSERQVVLEEIAMHEDDPGDVAMEKFYGQVLADAALARPILGTQQSIEGLPGERIRQFYSDHYRPPSVVIAAAGSLDHDVVVELVVQALRLSRWGAEPGRPQAIRGAQASPDRAASQLVLRRQTEQAHIVIGGPSMARNDPDKYALAVFNAVLGGGMSSRLFTRVREELGLAYSVYSFASPFADSGVFGVYAGTRPRTAEQTISVIREELDRSAAGLRPDEVARGKGTVRGSRLLALEDPFARMNRLGHAELVVGELPSIDEIQRRIEAVDEADIARVAARLIPTATSTIVVGPMPQAWQPE